MLLQHFQVLHYFIEDKLASKTKNTRKSGKELIVLAAVLRGKNMFIDIGVK